MFSVTVSIALGLLVLAWVASGAIAAAHAVMYKREPRSSGLWALLCIFLPFVGAWLYWALGINRVERKIVKRLGRRDRPYDPAEVLLAAASAGVAPTPQNLVPLRTVADRVTRLPLLPGNRIVPLHAGENAYPRMLDAIRGATQSVTLASYIFDWDDVGREFVQTLSDAARRGVRVHALLDGVGALESFSRVGRRLLRAGAQVSAFFPLRFPLGRVRVNLRNHRKILVVDGRLGFTGGMNISARHLMQSNNPRRADDLHFEITGPVVSEMQHAFVEDWSLATDQVLDGEAYFPPLPPTGGALCRGISSGPDEPFEILHWILQAAFSSAQHSVRVVTPYFAPTTALIAAMVTASLRGVKITIILPSMVDLRFMRWVADAYLWQLLEHGITVYRQPPPFAHTKLLIVDEQWILLGSANLDPRSLRLNFEFNVETYDAALAANLSRDLDRTVAPLTPVTLAELDARPKWRRFRDGLAKTLSPHL